MEESHTKSIEKYMPLIEVVSEEFEIPQLDKTRKIYALLPHDYYESEKTYPVLYLQDAQNLFNEHNPYGNWAIDKHLADLTAEGMGDIIVIAIDHGGKERIQEYSPYFHRKFGEGQGKHYTRFIINTLKPYIDEHYRTKPERRHSGIGGSSMGGLISAYVGIVYPEHFSRLMIFSPSFWYSDKIYFDAFHYNYTLPMRMYIYGGDQESEYMSRHIHRFKDAVKDGDYNNSLVKYKVVINPEGQHNEAYWSQVFPKAVKWLFFKNQSSLV
ncbi:MAG: alpha/beta hydrolase [Saprospiraceae bacterium]|nr:alpha/beta hydrolase [Saprospiraceae bacterium]